MSAELLLSQFGRVAGSPDAVPRLRTFILDLAVRGLLTEQAEGDEPASNLLAEINQIRAEDQQQRSRLRPREFAPIGADEEPFPVRKTWLWVRLRQITGEHGQAVPSADFTYIDVTAIDKKVGRIANPTVLTAQGAPSRARKIVAPGDVLYSCVRPYLLNVAVVEANYVPPPIASTAFAVLDGYGCCLPRYLWIVLRSTFFIECVEGKMRGQAYPAINDSDLAQLPIPLPPLAEQRRVVATLDELMAVCDQLEAAQMERELQRGALRSVSLHRLSSTNDSDDAKKDVRFFLNVASRLVTKSEHVGDLRQAILDVAAQGRLVPQEVSDLRHPRSEPGAGGLPFEVPAVWSVVDIRHTLAADRDISYGVIKLGPEPKTGGIPTLRCSDVKPRRLDLSSVRTVEPEIEREYARTRLRGGEIVINVRGTLGGVARVPPSLAGYNVAREVAVVPIASDIDADFIVNVMASTYFWDLVQESLRGIAYVGLNLRTLRDLPVPLPPLTEQRRIVAKVDELMLVCDELETALVSAQYERGRLLESLLRDALEGSVDRAEVGEFVGV